MKILIGIVAGWWIALLIISILLDNDSEEKEDRIPSKDPNCVYCLMAIVDDGNGNWIHAASIKPRL
jgi:hypothetical protein